MAEEKKRNKFTGYDWADPEKKYQDPMSGARGAKRAFETDTESMRSDYEKYKSKEDPSADEIAKRLGSGDEAAYDIMSKAHEKADEVKRKEWKRVTEMGPLRRRIYDATGFKKGGSVKGYSIDGIALRGKTRAKQK